MTVLFFFFSSRRRHTRFDCDWSSDVCSSDLPPPRGPRSRRCSTPPAPRTAGRSAGACRSEEHTSELQSQSNLVCRLLLEKKKKRNADHGTTTRREGDDYRTMHFDVEIGARRG